MFRFQRRRFSRLNLTVALLLFATSGGSKSVKLVVESGLRADEGAAIIAYGLVARIWVLGYDGVHGRNENEDEEDDSKGSVVDEEDNAHNPIDNGLEENRFVSDILMSQVALQENRKAFEE